MRIGPKGVLWLGLLAVSGCGRVGYELSTSDGDASTVMDASIPGDGENADGAMTGAPVLQSAGFVQYNQIEIQFDRPLDGIDAVLTTNYEILPVRPAGLEVLSAQTSPDKTLVTLTISKNHLPLMYALSAVVKGTDGTAAAIQSRTISGDQSRLLFQSSETGNAILSAWASASIGSSGAEAGDSICANLAATQGFIGTFVSNLSTAVADAPCRLDGLPGSYPACFGDGGPAAGPWINANGDFVTQDVVAALAHDIHHSVAYTETGAFAPGGTVWSGTYGSGVYAEPNSCADWSSIALDLKGSLGFSRAGITPFGSYNVTACSSNFSLLCTQSDANGFTTVPAPKVSGKKVFITSTTGPGDMAAWSDTSNGGLVGADEVCNARAMDGGLSGQYIAWLSSDTDDAYCRLIGGSGTLPGCNGAGEVVGPWVNTRGVVVASSSSDFLTPPLEHPIHIDENGNTVGNGSVYTGTAESGASMPERCSNWQSSDPASSAIIGFFDSAFTGYWTQFLPRTCSELRRIYCTQI